MADIALVDGVTTSASTGDRLLVRLDENPTTGYRWTMPEPTGVLRLEFDEFLSAGTGLPGAGGQRLIGLRATAPGRGAVRMELKRPWEDVPVGTFHAEVDVAG